MTIREIDEIIDEGNSLKSIAQAYAEIANLKIKKIRTQVERNRLFLQEISHIYSLVKLTANRKNIILAKPKKTISLVITSNYHFYGNINYVLIDFFINNIRQIDSDVIILGKVGIDFFKTSRFKINYQQLQLKSDLPQAEELLNLVKLVKDYNQVLVFHSKLKSLLIQQPAISEITASEQFSRETAREVSFIFEPELLKILSFFDSQISTLLLEGTFLESELARTASRFVSMDQAETEANKFIKDYQVLKAYTKRRLLNNIILENYATSFAGRRDKNAENAE